MAKVSFTSMKLKVDDSVKVIQIAGKDVEVKQYLSAAEKNSLIELVLQAATGGTFLNTFLADCYFDLYLVMYYTNINFTDNQKSDLVKLYDILETNGVFDIVVNAIPESEYNLLVEKLDEMLAEASKYVISAKAISDNLLQYGPIRSEEIAKSFEEFDEEKFKTLIEIVKGTNGDLSLGKND